MFAQLINILSMSYYIIRMDNKKTKEYKDKTDEELRQLIGRATEIFIKLTDGGSIPHNPLLEDIKEEVKEEALISQQKSTSPKTSV